jgi:ABC-type phosphate transport system substrate-binding protein
MRGNFLTIRGLFVIAATAFALLFAAGCGDSDDSATGSSGGDSSGSSTEEITVETGSLSKAAFVKKVEPVCRKALEKYQAQLEAAIGENRENPPKPTETTVILEFYEDGFGKIYQTLIDEISALGAPSGDEQEIAAYLEAVQKGIDEVAEDPEDASQAFLEAEANFKGTPPLTTGYGLPVLCP